MSYYRHHAFFCTHVREDGGACCGKHEAQALQDYAKQRIKELKLSGPGMCRINKAGCMDRCDRGPVMVVYPEGVWYSYRNRADIDEIIERHIQQGEIVERLQV